MQAPPRISIITPSYNCGRLVQRCIESVQAQNYPNLQHLVYDGASTDDTVSVLRRYSHIQWVSEPDRGEVDALNKALLKVDGDIICWLNADDYFMPNILTKVAQHFSTNSSLKVLYGNAYMVDESGHVLREKRCSPKVDSKLLLRWWLHDILPHQPSMFIAFDLIRQLGLFNQNLNYSIDYEYWLRMAALTPFHYLDEICSCATERADSKSIHSVPDQIASHWNVLSPYLERLSMDDQINFWSDYYWARSECPNHHEQSRTPNDATQGLGLIKAINTLKASPVEILNKLFIEQSTRDAVRKIIEVCQTLGSVSASTVDASLLKPISFESSDNARPSGPKIVIDGVFFQIAQTGVARFWMSLLAELAKTEIGPNILLLDRGGIAPPIPGIRTRIVLPYIEQSPENDRAFLQGVLDEENAALFLSTQYTTPLTTPSIQFVYDLIPEVFKWDMGTGLQWRDKPYALQYAERLISISESTKQDISKYYPELSDKQIDVVHPGIDRAQFQRSSDQQIREFKLKHTISLPYFLLVGTTRGTKNLEMFVEAMSQLPSQNGFAVVLVGVADNDVEWARSQLTAQVISLRPTDSELSTAYSGALSLVYPSLYEGFGLPVIEAMACECPVITTPFSSLQEAGGQAALYVRDARSLASALCEIQKPAVRNHLIQCGATWVNNFSWFSAAQKVSAIFSSWLASSRVGYADSTSSTHFAQHG